jgi:uncharacterized protein (TIGR02271 family)
MNQTPNVGPEPTANESPFNDEPADRNTAKNITIPVIEEQVQIDKKVVESGGVRITKVVSEQEVPVDIPLIHEEHDIQRIPINQYVETLPPPIRYEGDTMIIPVMREVLVVEKRLLLVEELHVTKSQVHKQETQHITLRKEEVIVERLAPNPTGDQPV